MRAARRYALAPWADPAPSDLVPQGDPETRLTYRKEEHLGLHVRGQFVGSLGMLAIRCLDTPDGLTPWSVAIADDAPVAGALVPVNVQSNPRKVVDDDGA